MPNLPRPILYVRGIEAFDQWAKGFCPAAAAAAAAGGGGGAAAAGYNSSGAGGATAANLRTSLSGAGGGTGGANPALVLVPGLVQVPAVTVPPRCPIGKVRAEGAGTCASGDIWIRYIRIRYIQIQSIVASSSQASTTVTHPIMRAWCGVSQGSVAHLTSICCALS